MTERGPQFDAAREAYEAAQTRLRDMCDKPPRDITVPMYRVMLARGLRDQKKAHDVMMEAWRG